MPHNRMTGIASSSLAPCLFNGHPEGVFPVNAVNHLIDIKIVFISGKDALDFWNKGGTMFFFCSSARWRHGMLKIFVEEAAALASISLFVGMIAVWAQLIPQL